jgi:hypothetical protein
LSAFSPCALQSNASSNCNVQDPLRSSVSAAEENSLKKKSMRPANPCTDNRATSPSILSMHHEALVTQPALLLLLKTEKKA